MTKKLPTIQIKGKSYVMVKDRIVAFNELYPKGRIITKIVKNDELSVVCQAVVYPDVSNLDRAFSGHSEAYRNNGQMGQVPVEVAETSAVGRALAMLGIGIVDSIASADEMKKASHLVENARTGQPSSIVDYQEMENVPGAFTAINDAKKEFNRSQPTNYKSPVASKSKVNEYQIQTIKELCELKGVKVDVKTLPEMTSFEAAAKISALKKMADTTDKIDVIPNVIPNVIPDDDYTPTEEELQSMGL